MAAAETDQQLVEKVQAGDKRAFDLLVIKYQPRILGLVSRYVNDSHEVQDVTQEAFIKAYRALPRFRGDSAFYTWLYRIAINTAKNHLVPRGRRPPGFTSSAALKLTILRGVDRGGSKGVEVIAEIEDAEHFENGGALRDMENPENNLFSRELAEVVKNAISDLPDDLRTAVTLREFDGLSYEDIAEVMDCPVGTVRSRIFRAREAIDKKVRAQVDGENLPQV